MVKISTIEIDSIQKKFNYRTILSDVYLSFSTGEVLGMLGRNGSGKSTLLKIIFGLETADYKFIKINGLVKTKSSEILPFVSYLDQNQFIPKQFSVKSAILLSINSSELDLFYQDDMIQQMKSRFVNELSGGELRYLEVKIVLFNDSQFVFLDEPYNGLSPIMINKINEIIESSKSKKAILITDHNYHEILKVSTKIILLKDGKTYPINEVEELYKHGYLTKY